MLFGLLILLLCADLPATPALDWPRAEPGEVGIDAAKLEALRQTLADSRTTAFLVVRRGKIVLEWYAPGHDALRKQGTASLAKAVVGGVSLMLAMDQGLIRPDDLASRYISSWRDDPRKSRIQIQHLATHTSGIEDAEQDGLAHDRLPGWKGAFWRRDPDPFSIALRDAPALFAPGTEYAYSNPGMAALAYAVTASLKGSPQPDIKELLRVRVMEPLGVAEPEWSIGYGRSYELGGLQIYANWGGGAFTPRAVAAVGALMLERGTRQGRLLIARRVVEEGLRPAGLPDSKEKYAPTSGLGWWLNANGAWPEVPRDAFAGAGAGHQFLLVVPSLDLIVVRNGQALNPEARARAFWEALATRLMQPLMDAIVDRAPYPPSQVVETVEFEPAASIRCEAIDSDNWPITWAADGEQYASYGDGWGFEPRTERKLSMGFARISGQADDFRGVNIRSETGERAGDGARGLKASGMILVKGRLYMWVRNAGNAELWVSHDMAKSWKTCFKFQESFGSPSFLNFGRDYSGARDGYVYTYSQQGGSAYESDNGLLLVRVPVERVEERSAWEFFSGLDASAGRPVWTADLSHRHDVFRYPWNCQRVDAVYHPGLKRFLLALGYGHTGGWGLYEAPEPWGPWATVFHTANWGLGGTHGYRLPAKWIGSDGAMVLIFSGVKPYDAFCVRRMVLKRRAARTAHCALPTAHCPLRTAHCALPTDN